MTPKEFDPFTDPLNNPNRATDDTPGVTDELLKILPNAEGESGWVTEAREKNLPADFIERLQDTDGVSEAEKARLVASVDTARDLELKRAAAVEMGRRYGEDEANRRSEIGSDREGRIARAMAYAAWEFDGKPLSSQRQREEFGVPGTELVGSLERGSSPRILRKAR